MSVGARISDLRKQQHISQGQLAKDLGISRQAVSKWENDQSSPDTINLIKLADILNTEVEYLATGRMPVHEPIPPIQPVPQISSTPPTPPAPTIININLIEKPEPTPAKVIIREVPKRILVRQKPRLNPIFWIAFGGIWFSVGLILGLLL